MKVTCISCHKKFDNDKYYGICPKCGAFNKLHFGVDDHASLHQMYDDDKNMHSDYASHESLHQMYDDDKDIHSDYASHESFHQTYDEDKDIHSDYASHEQFHEKYDDTTSHAKVSTDRMSGSSVYSDELSKSRRAKVQTFNKAGADDKSKNVGAVKWIIIIVILANVLPAIINWFHWLIFSFLD